MIYTRDRQVLLLKRADHPDFWQSVTGSLRWGESAPDAARRELSEETGLIALTIKDWQLQSDYEILPQWRHRYAPGTTTNYEQVFGLELAAQQAIRLKPTEHSEYRWLPLATAIDRVWSWTNRVALQRLDDRR